VSSLARPRANPFFLEAARACFSRRPILRASIAAAAVLGCLFVLWWPRGPIVSSLPPLAGPRTLTVVSVGLLAALAWLSARLGAEDYAAGSFIPAREYAAITPRAAGTVVRGKLGFGLLHTVFLAALGAPFVLASAGVSRVPLEAGLLILVVAAAAAAAFRALGLFLLCVLPSHGLVRDMIMLAAGAAAAALSTALFPAGSPVSAVLALSGAGAVPPPLRVPGAELSFWLVSVIMSLLAAAVLAAGASASLAAAGKARNARASN
jgi:hypothetical protein